MTPHPPHEFVPQILIIKALGGGKFMHAFNVLLWESSLPWNLVLSGILFSTGENLSGGVSSPAVSQGSFCPLPAVTGCCCTRPSIGRHLQGPLHTAAAAAAAACGKRLVNYSQPQPPPRWLTSALWHWTTVALLVDIRAVLTLESLPALPGSLLVAADLEWDLGSESDGLMIGITDGWPVTLWRLAPRGKWPQLCLCPNNKFNRKTPENLPRNNKAVISWLGGQITLSFCVTPAVGDLML